MRGGGGRFLQPVYCAKNQSRGIKLCYKVDILIKCSYIRKEVDFIREATLTVSPNKQYLGILFPTIPVATCPGKRMSIIFSSGIHNENLPMQNTEMF